jgi:hypothetical protein
LRQNTIDDLCVHQIRSGRRDAWHAPHTPHDVHSERKGILLHAVADACSGAEEIAAAPGRIVDVGGNLIVFRMNSEASGAAGASDEPVRRREQVREVGRQGREQRRD